DGFSFAAPMIVAFEGGVDDSNLVHYSAYADSVGDTSPTVIIDMTNGGRVVHFAELDLAAAATPSRQALYLRPAARLHGGTRYAVGIRTSLKGKDGGPLPISPGFEALLSGASTNHPLLEKVRPRYVDIFAAFEAEGISRDELVVAWDFTTASDEYMRADLIAARDIAITEMGTAGANLTYTVGRTDPDGDPAIRWRIEGQYDAPLFLTLDGRFNFNTTLARDAAGVPEYQGMYSSPFVAIVPECAYLPENQPVGIIIYGHGLFGSAGEVGSSSQRLAAATSCRVVIGTNLRGMSENDVGNTAIALNNLNKAPNFFLVITQGIINTIALEHIVRGPMAESLFVDDQNQSIVDPTDVVYYGNSQGHIFGATFVAYDPFITRGVLGVGGANYSMMLERSSDWPTYGVIMAGAYPDQLDQSIDLNLVQMYFDFTDPVGTANDILTGGIPGTPPKQLMLHMAVGDHQVPNITTEFQARTMGIPVLTPTPYVPYGITEATGPLAAGSSAMVIYDGGEGSGIQRGNVPPVGTEDPHGMPRKQPAAVRQMTRFWDTGEITHECGDTACFCYDGACD
ncbi:MAG TPA: hypothetical protein VML75_05410, partial [Kofleriaceae bacterium]|nr:hypothetical protein [Kofleriaceae bacterium]